MFAKRAFAAQKHSNSGLSLTAVKLSVQGCILLFILGETIHDDAEASARIAAVHKYIFSSLK